MLSVSPQNEWVSYALSVGGGDKAASILFYGTLKMGSTAAASV